ncbi:MAG: ATP-binding protein [Cyanobacteria bacterium J06639_1]
MNLTRYLNRDDRVIQRQLAAAPAMTDPIAIANMLDRADSVRRITVPIESLGQPLGEVWLGYTQDNVRAEAIATAAMTVGAIAIGTLALAGLTIVLFNRWVSKPLKHIADMSEALAEGSMERCLYVTSNDEIGQLSRSFNSMADRLQATLTGLAEARDKALASNRAKSEFLANMSHELRTPLNAILGFSQIMARDTTLSETHQSTVATINRSGEHLLSLINDVLEMAKIEAGRIFASTSKFELAPYLESIVEMIDVRAKSKGLHLTVDYLSDIPKFVEADENKLRQVLINLLGNAVKFTNEGSVILYVEAKELDISAASASSNDPSDETDAASSGRRHAISFMVEDTGPGIAAEDMETIFEAFIQTDVGRSSTNGTGLGLPISRKYVQLMGGDLAVKSEVDRGTTFAFTIPVVEVESADTRREIQRRVVGIAPGQPQYRILVVDDNAENRNLLSKLLEMVGFDVRVGETGMDAVEMWKHWEPHLIWMDMRMPVMDGYEATSYIRELEEDDGDVDTNAQVTVILALTAFAFEEQRTKALNAGCNDYVRKPFRENEVFEKLADYLNIQYLYEGDDGIETNNDSAEAIADDEVKSVLRELPESWRSELFDAAELLDSEVASEVVARIASDRPALARTLQQWIDEFRFDLIAEAIAAASPAPAERS